MGSTPTLVTDKHDPVVQWRRRLDDTQENGSSILPGITRWSVGVPAAHLLGKEGDRVRFPDGPLDTMGGWSNGKTPGLHPGDRGSIPRPVHYEPPTKDRRKAAPKSPLHDVYVPSLDGKRKRPLQGQGRTGNAGSSEVGTSKRQLRADGPTGRHRPGVAEIRVRLPVGPLIYGR